mmetsp:Transcript_1224/g.1400  ORF Transcript_1224/g.1400 Transcript_1224/m.1400 type:complete len:130 (+) Transcript_1224:580-969(+)|eukprot:CAMPEP_0170498144 /NCGR_PEP_ID=MMETSP0208-20121228/26958_1 /TAXON_ID=197538 /ORGANISM="Strombidium inclinatum, Strain S3" /LENGTH=129 /DNA_ID=CAMNT_0010775227 /DNA_START=519 /DNA_END=908 /DNA_ORIENTATION=-
MTRFRKINKLDQISEIDKNDLAIKLDFCEQISRKIQVALINNQVDFQQLHVDATLPCSMAMSALTNSVYNSCDLWSAFNKMAAYNIRQDTSLSLIEKSHFAVKDFWGKFSDLKENDFDKKLKAFKKGQP